MQLLELCPRMGRRCTLFYLRTGTRAQAFSKFQQGWKADVHPNTSGSSDGVGPAWSREREKIIYPGHFHPWNLWCSLRKRLSFYVLRNNQVPMSPNASSHCGMAAKVTCDSQYLAMGGYGWPGERGPHNLLPRWDQEPTLPSWLLTNHVNPPQQHLLPWSESTWGLGLLGESYNSQHVQTSCSAPGREQALLQC